MNKIYKNKKIIFVTIAVLIFAYFAISSSPAEAQSDPIGEALKGAATARGASGGTSGLAKGAAGLGLGFLGKVGEATSWGLAIFGLLQVLYHLLFWFVTFAYGLLNSAVAMALNPYWFQMGAILKAWQLVRDFVNVWFILILLFIAIGTILRATNFQAKKLLPTIILMALVVNFSMPVSKFVIDIANIVAFQFLKSICVEKVESTSGLKSCDVSASLENVLDAKIYTQALQELPEKPQSSQQKNTAEKKSAENGFIAKPAHAQGIGIVEGFVIAQAVLGAVSILAGGWSAIQAYLGNSSILGVATQQFVGILVSDIFLAVTAYVILSLAILYLIRIVTLLFIVIISPLGFVMTALPGTQSYGKMWWNKLITQSFFAPISLFFLWISISLMGSLKSSLEAINNPAFTGYDLSSPVNVRLIFYIFSLILLYASLWISRKMGAFGADTLMKWAGAAQGAITGFVGGLAARRFVAPIGGAMTAAGLPEAIGRISPIAGVKARDFAEYLSKRGKAPEDAGAKAELGMRLAPAERAAYFAKLDRAAKEAMLRKMKGEERESLIASLPDTQKQITRDILGSYAFTGEEQLKSAVDKFKYENNLPAQWKKYATDLDQSEQKAFLLGIEKAEDRAGFLEHVRDEAQKALDEKGDRAAYDNGMKAFKNANDFLEKSSAFSANQLYANTSARFREEHTREQRANRLFQFFENIADKQEQKRRFRFVMDDVQKLEIVEGRKDDEEKLKEIAGWMLEQSPSDQDKFYRETLGRRGSLEGVVAYIKAINTKDPNRDLSIKKAILSGASAAQLGNVAREIPELGNIVDDLALRMSKTNRVTYEETSGRILPKSGGGGSRGPTPPPTPSGGPSPVSPTPTTPATTAEVQNIVKTSDAISVARYINKLNPATNDLEKIISAVNALKLESDEKQAEALLHLNPIIKVWIGDGIEPSNTQRFEEILARDIKRMSKPDLVDQIYENPSVISNNLFLRATLKGSDTPKLISLMHNYPEIKEFVKEQINRREMPKDPELHAQAIADMFEKEFKNKELSITLSDIRRKPKEELSPIARALKNNLFGE